MAKLKYKKDKDVYSLTLNEQEALVIAKILSCTRLGNPDKTDPYEQAVFEIVRAFEKGEPGLLEKSYEIITVEVQATSDGVTPAATIQDENVMIVVSATGR